MSLVDEKLIDYILSLYPVTENKLNDIRVTAEHQNVPIIPRETAQLLCVMLSVVQPKKILEIGCAVGFSASMMHGYLAPNGKIITIERYQPMIEKAKENFKQMGLEDQVTLLEGDANILLKEMDDTFDVIFMDAAKGQYIHILPDCLRLLKVGGLLIADDVLQDGSVLLPPTEIIRRNRTIHKRLNDFLYTLTNTEGLCTTILPVGDGVTITHKQRDVTLPTFSNA